MNNPVIITHQLKKKINIFFILIQNKVNQQLAITVVIL